MKTIFKLTIITLLILLTSCRSKKNAGCDAYSEYKMENDSSFIRVYHYHIENQKNVTIKQK
jgi:hypothetical protein